MGHKFLWKVLVTVVVTAIVVFLFSLNGCSVWLSAERKSVVERQYETTKEMVVRCQDGTLTQEQMCETLDKIADTLEGLLNASEGKE